VGGMKKRILVIDDEESVRKLMNNILVRAGYDVFQAEDGEDALSLLSSNSVDLIILDMNMPRMDGITFLKNVNDKSITDVPVLMMSGSSNVEQRLECYRLGVYDFVKKPEAHEVMLKRIENGLKIGDMINFNNFIKMELFMAKKLQKYLFPDPSIETEAASIDIWSRPLSDVGGDLHDYVVFRNGKIIFFIADVSGHSISAALFTAIVKMVFRNAIKETEDPSSIMKMMNDELAENLPIESFVTMFCGVIDPKKSELTYSNGGHPGPWLLSSSRVKELTGNDPFLGPMKDIDFNQFCIKLQPGEAIILFTDGIFDVQDSSNTVVGEELFKGVLNDKNISHRNKFYRIIEKVSHSDLKFIDDCTLMLIEYRGIKKMSNTGKISSEKDTGCFRQSR